MRRRIFPYFTVVCGILVAAPLPAARAIDAVFIPGQLAGTSYRQEKIEVQGASGRIDLPVTFPAATLSSSLLGYSIAGATANDTTLYTLLSSIQNSVLILTDPHSGASLGTIQLGARFSDIAYTNGQLYGIVNNSTSLQIDSIAANGASQSIFSQTVSSLNSPWRLSGVTNGDDLLAAREVPSTSNTSGLVINPTTLATSSIPLPGTALATNLIDTVINSAGTIVTSLTSATSQTAASFPAGVSLGALSSSTRYGTGGGGQGVVSDEFTYTYSPSMPAAVQTTWNTSSSPPIQGLVDGLTRTPQVVTLSGPVSISNYAVPDATTLSNLSATNLIQQGSGDGPTASPFTISTQPAAPGNLSNRSLGQATATINLATAQRAIYGVASNPVITADYNYSSIVDPSRNVFVSSSNIIGSDGFAYDPISSNIVGNGDASLEQFGWEGIQGPTLQNGFVNPDPSNHSFDLIPEANFPVALRQFLQLPTAPGPMVFSFTYFLDLFPDKTPVDIQVFLNGTQIADVTASTSSIQTFQTTITDPTLENLVNAPLLFQTTSTDPSGDFVEIGNISLTAVPEPASASLLFFTIFALGRRRSRTT